MRLLERVACCAAIAVGLAGSADSAGAEALGARFEQVRDTYPGAAYVKMEGRAALELKDEDYGGVHWDRIDFIFDAAGRLDHLSMSTASSSYEAVRRLAELQLTPPASTQVARMASREEVTDEMEIRICESDDGQVTMTYEPTSTLS